MKRKILGKCSRCNGTVMCNERKAWCLDCHAEKVLIPSEDLPVVEMTTNKQQLLLD